MSEFLNINDSYKRWMDIRNAFDSFSLEDIYTLRKAIELKQVDTYWNLGFIHIAKLQMLMLEFRYDETLKEIYEYMLERVNEWMLTASFEQRDLTEYDLQRLFKDQPVVEAPMDKLYLGYNVKSCKYKRRLLTKYPELSSVIEDMINT